jgi:hypothetical protein
MTEPSSARLAERLIALAEEGDLAAIREIVDRLEGKPRQAIRAFGRVHA